MPSLSPRLDKILENKILNGAFDLWQRGITTTATAASDTYLADRWQTNAWTGGISVTTSRSVDVPTLAQSSYQSSYSLLITNNTSVSQSLLTTYSMEGYDYAPIHGQKIRLQFWVKSSIAGTYSVGLKNGASTRSWVSTYTIPTANTWTKITKDVTLDSTGSWSFDNTAGMRVMFGISNNPSVPVGISTSTHDTWQNGDFRISNSVTAAMTTTAGATFQLAQVALIPGDFSNQGTNVDIPFLRAGGSYSNELRMCMRYYQIIDVSGNVVGFSSTATSGIGPQGILFPTEMRATPNLSLTSNTINLINITANTSSSQSLTVQGQSSRHGRMYPSGTSNGIVYAYNALPVLADAEL
jgi:hypothetical protein